MVIVILADVPTFLRNEKNLGNGNPVQESDTPAYLRSFKMAEIDFSSQKTFAGQIFRSFRLLAQNLRSFKFFLKKFNGPHLRFGFPQFPLHGKSISSRSFQDIAIPFLASTHSCIFEF